jgi:hypothetical protein
VYVPGRAARFIMVVCVPGTVARVDCHESYPPARRTGQAWWCKQAGCATRKVQSNNFSKIIYRNDNALCASTMPPRRRRPLPPSTTTVHARGQRKHICPLGLWVHEWRLEYTLQYVHARVRTSSTRCTGASTVLHTCLHRLPRRYIPAPDRAAQGGKSDHQDLGLEVDDQDPTGS